MRVIYLIVSFSFLSLAGAAVVGAYCYWTDFLAFGHSADKTLTCLSSAGALVAGLGAAASYRIASFYGSERF